MIEKEKLRYWAMELEKEMARYKTVSTCAAELYKFPTLLEAIQDAKNYKIFIPSEKLGNLKPYFEYTDILSFLSLGNALGAFSILLEGRKLPSDVIVGKP